MKKLLISLLLGSGLVAQTNVQKGSGNVLSNGPVVVGSGNSITATGSGIIHATISDGAPPTGTAGGVLTGTYPNPTLNPAASPTLTALTLTSTTDAGVGATGSLVTAGGIYAGKSIISNATRPISILSDVGQIRIKAAASDQNIGYYWYGSGGGLLAALWADVSSTTLNSLNIGDGSAAWASFDPTGVLAQNFYAGGFLNLTSQGSAPATPAASLNLYSNATHNVSWKQTNGWSVVLATNANTGNRTYTFPDASGTVTLNGESPLTFSAPLSRTGNVVSIPPATSSVNGYLTSTDWSTFNGKQAAGNYLTALTGDGTASGPGSAALTLATVNASPGTYAGLTVNAKGLITAAGNRTITTTAPLTGGGVLGNLTLALPASTNSVDGYLTAVDHTAFSAKQPAGNYITALTGDGTASGPGSSTLTLATVNSNVGSFGSATAAPTFTVDAKGRLTAAGSVTVTPAFASLTSTPTTLTGYGVTNTLSTTAPLTGGGTLASNLTVAIPASTNSVNGYLTAADHTTFAAKQSALTFSGGVTNTAGTVTVDKIQKSSGGTDSIDWGNHFLIGGSGTGVVDWDGGALNNSTGNISLDWFNRALLNESGQTTASWEDQTLSDLGGEVSVDWQNRQLLDAFGGLSVNWFSRILTGAWTGTSLSLNPSAGTGFLQLGNQSVDPSTPTTSLRLYADSSNRLGWRGTNGFIQTLDMSNNTSGHAYIFPDSNGTLVLTANAQTLTNKTISGASNTLTNIGNSSLTNSAITIAGTSTSLGGSITLDTIDGIAANGMIARTAANTRAARTITGTSGQVTVTNGDGVAGNPTIALPATLTQTTTFSNPTTFTTGTAPFYAARATGTSVQGLFFGQVATLYGTVGSAYYFNSSQWQTPNTAASAMAFNNDGSISWYADSGLTANTSYTPTIRAQLFPSGVLILGASVTATTTNGVVKIGSMTGSDYFNIGGGKVFAGDTTDATTAGAGAAVFAGGMNVAKKGYFAGGLLGTTTNNNAAAGCIGEYVSSLIGSGSAVSLTTATSANVTSISLTAGDWDVEGHVNYAATAATTTQKTAGISQTSATLPSDGSEVYSGVSVTTSSATDSVTLDRIRVSISGTTTVYLVGRATFTLGAVSAYGQITARRVR